MACSSRYPDRHVDSLVIFHVRTNLGGEEAAKEYETTSRMKEKERRENER